MRLIGESGEQLGILSYAAAMRQATDRDLDLVLMAEEAKPPVCKLLDYKKYIFAKKKQQVLAKKKHRRTQIKEIKFRLATAAGDYQVKLKRLMQFLSQGDKVKISIRFRGREMMYQDQGHSLLARIQGDMADLGELEQEAKMEGRQMITVYKPSQKKRLEPSQEIQGEKTHMEAKDKPGVKIEVEIKERKKAKTQSAELRVGKKDA